MFKKNASVCRGDVYSHKTEDKIFNILNDMVNGEVMTANVYVIYDNRIAHIAKMLHGRIEFNILFTSDTLKSYPDIEINLSNVESEFDLYDMMWRDFYKHFDKSELKCIKIGNDFYFYTGTFKSILLNNLEYLTGGLYK